MNIALFSSPLRPLDMFNMNYSSGISISSIVFTYMIILLQFKMSDFSPSTNDLFLNSSTQIVEVEGTALYK